jgi:hypothetical protein
MIPAPCDYYFGRKTERYRATLQEMEDYIG